jgi:tetratricopeptide (TPR) repeat protein
MQKGAHFLKRTVLFWILLLTILPYLYPMRYSEFLKWDDDLYLTKNKNIQKEDGFSQIWIHKTMPNPYPITFSAIHLQYRLFGLKAPAFHFVNLGLHLFAVVLFWWVLTALSVRGLARALAVALYAVHPVQVETVMWVSEIKNLLCAIFYWLSFLCFLCFFRNTGKKRFFAYLGLFVCFIASLLSKSMSVTLPVTFTLWVLLFASDKKTLGRLLLWILPLWGVSFFFGTLSMQNEQRLVNNYSAQEVSLQRSLEDRLLMAVESFYFYLYKFFWPSPLMAIYPTPPLFPSLLWLKRGAMLFLFMGIAFLLGKTWRSPDFPRLLTFSFLNYGIVAGPILGFFSTSYLPISSVSDRYQYHPLPFLALFIALLLEKLWLYVSPRLREWMGLGFSLLFFALLTLSYYQSIIWANSVNLWTQTIRHNPHPLAYLGLAITYWDKGDYDQSLFLYEEALKLSPKDYRARLGIGNCLSKKGQYDLAKSFYESALPLCSFDGVLYGNLGSLYQKEGDSEKALALYEKALSVKQPDYTVSLRLGNLYWERQFWDKAKEAYLQALSYSIEPENAYLGLALVYTQLGEKEKAKDAFEKGLQVNSQILALWMNFYFFYYHQNRYSEGLQILERALFLFKKKLQSPQEIQEYLRLEQERLSLLLTCPEPSFRQPKIALLALESLMKLAETSSFYPSFLEMYLLALTQEKQFPQALEKIKEGIEKSLQHQQNEIYFHFKTLQNLLRNGASLTKEN